MMKKGALAGLKILDLGRIQAAPYCAALLADMGAEVIKIEQPGTGDDARSYIPQETYFAAFNRGKKGLTLNLKTGRDIFLRLVREADVLLENFRPGVMKRLGLDYETLREINPRLVYCCVSAFGQTGPYSGRSGFDPLIQAMSGIMSVTGFPDGEPVRAGIAVSDILGGLNAAIGILAALRYRDISGEGQLVDISLADCAISSMTSVNQEYLSGGAVRGRMGNAYGTGAPGGVYQASDGSFMYAGANDTAWRKICEAMGRPELTEQPELKTRELRAEHRGQVDEIMNGWTKQRTVAENLALFGELGLPVGEIMDVSQVFEDPQFGIDGERPMFRKMEHPTLGSITYTDGAIRMSATPPEPQRPSPELGGDNDEILSALGFSPEEIAQFARDGIT